MQQCRMIALKSMLAERTHVFFHTSQCMRKNRVCVGNSHMSCTTCHYKSQVQAVFRSIHGQSWSETVRSKCSHSCGTTRFNFGKYKVEDTFWSQQTRLPLVDMGCKKTSNRVATITSQSTTDDLQQSSNQYQHGCEVQLNIPGKQLRLWTAGYYRCSLGEQTVQTRCITSQSRSKYVVARPSRTYSHGILFTKICIHVFCFRCHESDHNRELHWWPC